MKKLFILLGLTFICGACSTEESRCYSACVKEKDKKYKHIGGANSKDKDACYWRCRKK